ncbi:MAG: PQQ-binding-like beta-propeller repeat protein [Candidatus Thorarchaeota archaeon]
MKTIIFYSAVILLLLASMSAYGKNTTQSEDELHKAALMNSKHHPVPTTSYRKGHVSHHPAKHYVKTTRQGYVIDLPGKYPIATPTYHKGRLYVSGGFGSRQFYCFDAKTGKTIWTIDLDDDGPSSCVIEDGIVVFNTESCTLFACNAENGQMLWSWWLGDPLTSAPAISNGRVFTTYPANGQGPAGHSRGKKHPDASHVMGCFDLRTGKILWQKWIDGDAISAPVVLEPVVYITTFSGTLYTFNTKDGAIGSAVKARATSAPTIIDDQIYYSKRTDIRRGNVKESIAAGNKHQLNRVATFHEKKADYLDEKIQKESGLDKKSKSLDAGNGFSATPQASGYQKAYKNVGQGSVSSMQSFQGSRILNYQKKNYSTMGDELLCTDSKSGKIMWKTKFKGDLKESGGFLATPPLAVKEHIIVATLNGDIEQFKANTGELEKRYRLNAPIRFQPIVQDGRIFTGTQDGQVICINTRDPELTGWPTWGRDAARTGIMR